MLDLLEEGFNLGLGVASVAFNKVDGLVKDSLAKAGVKPEETKDLHKKLVDEGVAARAKIKEEYQKQMAKVADFSPCAVKLDAILAKLDKLEAEIAELKKG